MATKDPKADDSLLKEKRGPDLQEMLTEVGLSVEYWLPKLQEHLGVTHAQALQHIDRKELQKLKLQVHHSWEKRALEKLIDLAQSNSTSVLENSPVQMIKKRQMQAKQGLQELKDSQRAHKQRQEESMRSKETELRKEMEIPKEYWPPTEQPLSQVMESIQKQLNLTTQTLSHRQNLPDRDLVRRASGGLALQGIYKTSHQTDLMQKREELLSVPEEFILYGPEQGTRMESREFTSSQTESMFTKIVETLGFSVAASGIGEGWGFRLEAGVNQSTHSESKDTQQSWSKRTYFCSVKLSYIPLASCHFPMDQLQLSKAAFQELKTIEKLLNETSDSDRLPLLRQKTENFFLRFGSHANQGPLHLGGIYWWKATAEGFQSHQLDEVKMQAAEALDAYIRGSYNGFGVNIAGEIEASQSQSKAKIQMETLQNLQTTVQLSVSQSGGPAEADGLQQWKAGLVASNQTWHVIDRGLQLVPIWDIILSNHTSDFKDPLQLASCLKDNYIALFVLTAQIQGGEEILSAEKEIREFLEKVKSWEVSDPEKQLKQLMDFMQMLSHKMKGYDTWIKLCLTDPDLQNFLVNTFDFCKKSPTYNTKFIKSQFQSLLDPHIYKINFPHTHSIMQWIYQTEAEPELMNISPYSQSMKTRNVRIQRLLDVGVNYDSMEIVDRAQRRVMYERSEACDIESIHATSNIFAIFLGTLKVERLMRDGNYIQRILRLTKDMLKAYAITNEDIIFFSLYLFHRAAEIFKERHRAIKAANILMKYLVSKKDVYFLSFDISCQEATSITTFVDFLWQKLTPTISNTIWEEMPRKIAEYLRSTCPAFSGNRANLEKHILVSLAEEENFDKYWQYIHDPKSFFSTYIGNHVKQYCLNEGVAKIKTFFQLSLGNMKVSILSAILESTAVAKDKGSTASEWLDLFCDHLGSNLIFPRRDLVNIEHQEIKDIEFLKEAMSAHLDSTMKEEEKKFSSLPIDEMVPEIEKILSIHLCGCWKQCPRCKAICTNTIPNHDGDHSTPFHRPQAVSGLKWHKTDHFIIDSCSTLVASNHNLIWGDGQKFPYKNDQQAGGNFATWNITPDSSIQPYWKWFVSHFRSKLEEKYKNKFQGKSEIPNTWMQITKHDVLKDLKK